MKNESICEFPVVLGGEGGTEMLVDSGSKRLIGSKFVDAVIANVERAIGDSTPEFAIEGKCTGDDKAKALEVAVATDAMNGGVTGGVELGDTVGC
jgi:hypothetical protein